MSSLSTALENRTQNAFEKGFSFRVKYDYNSSSFAKCIWREFCPLRADSKKNKIIFESKPSIEETMFSLPDIPLVPAFGLGATELIIILVIILIIFGAGKLPKVMQSLGTGIRSFKKAAREDAEDEEEPEEDEVEKAKIAKKEVKNLSEGKKAEDLEVEEVESKKKQEAEV